MLLPSLLPNLRTHFRGIAPAPTDQNEDVNIEIGGRGGERLQLHNADMNFKTVVQHVIILVQLANSFPSPVPPDCVLPVFNVKLFWSMVRAATNSTTTTTTTRTMKTRTTTRTRTRQWTTLTALCPYILLALWGSLPFWWVALALCPYILLALLGSLPFWWVALALCPYILLAL